MRPGTLIIGALGCDGTLTTEDRVSASPSHDHRGYVRLVTVLGAASLLGFGVWAFGAPRSFFDTLATFEPFNVHLIRDIGAFQIGLGAVLALSLLSHSIGTITLGGVGIGAAVHAVGHLLDRDLGGRPSTDIPTFFVLAIALLVGAWLARSDVG